ncbi:MAG: molybdopterin-dependent oxidoreductase [Ferruginibacter sp.]
MKKAITNKSAGEIANQKKINRRTFFSFATFFGTGALMFGGWKWLNNTADETPGITAGLTKPLRRALNQNELAFQKTFSNNHLVKTYPKSMAAPNVRVNSLIGIEDEDYDVKDWQMSVLNGEKEIMKISLPQIIDLPKTEIIFDFKCVEGWDQVQHWGGVSMVDFIAHFNLQAYSSMNYMGMATPDQNYYVGLDMESALHPQTLLAYEMNGKPLSSKHGAPLRLIIPVKYGIKNLKRIGSISFGNTRPPDYWAENGYDYYSGL